MFKKLRIRLTVLCVISTGVVLLGLTLFFLKFTLTRLEKQNFMDFESSQKNVTLFVKDSAIFNHTTLKNMERNNQLIIGVFSNGEPIQFTESNATKLALTTTALQVSQLASFTTEFSSPSATVFQIIENGQSYWVAVSTMTRENSVVTLVMLRERQPEQQEKQRIIYIMLGVFLLSLLFLFLVSYVFIGHSIKPIEESQRKQQSFVSSASHELRSPISVILATVGVLRFAPEEKQSYFLNKIETECDRMSDLITGLLELASLENSKTPLGKEPLNPTQLLVTTEESFQSMAKEKKIELYTLFSDSPLPSIYGNESLILSVLSIYTENALRYTPEKGSICLSTKTNKNNLIFTVSDTGSGIEEKDANHLFDRFYQSDNSHTQKEHFGLGLSIAAEIAKAHGGKVSAKNNAQGGASFSLSLPIYKKGGHKNV